LGGCGDRCSRGAGIGLERRGITELQEEQGGGRRCVGRREEGARSEREEEWESGLWAGDVGGGEMGI
jgi:hypothetical protein